MQSTQLGSTVRITHLCPCVVSTASSRARCRWQWYSTFSGSAGSTAAALPWRSITLHSGWAGGRAEWALAGGRCQLPPPCGGWGKAIPLVGLPCSATHR